MFNDVVRRLKELTVPSVESLLHVIDVLLVAFLLYRFLLVVRSTRAWRVMVGIVIFMAVLFLSDYLQLRTLHWLLDKATLLGPVALVILFLPELRQTLEGFGRLGLLTDAGLVRGAPVAAKTIEEIVAAVAEMSSQRTGALIVIERGVVLDEIAQNGVMINAEVSAPLLNAVFYHGNPLHDGAAVLRGDKVLAGSCRLPLSESKTVDKSVHMRHRAAVGITEQADCLVVVVSEERGTISLAENGTLLRLQDHIELRDRLNHELRDVDSKRIRRRRKRTETEVSA